MSRFLHWRKMTYALYAWCALILVWVIAGASKASHTCDHSAYLQACQAGAHAGTAIGVAIILLIGFVGFVFLSIIWFMTRPKP